MDLKLKDKVIVVKGGAKGIVLGIAEILAIKGAIAVVVGRNRQDNQEAVEKLKSIGAKAFSVEAELSNPEASENAVKAIIAEFGRIEGLINNAGVYDGVGLETGNYDNFLQSHHSNLIHY